MKRFAALSAILLIPFIMNANGTKPSWHGPDRPIYVVTQNHYAEGFGPEGETARFTDLIAIEIYNPKARPTGQDATYNVGEKIGLFVGGQRQGNIKIEKVLGLQCDSSAAVVSADTSAGWDKDVMALGTNASGISGHASAQRPANEAEKSIAKRLAVAEFRKHGVPEQLAREIQFAQAVVTKLDQNRHDSLVANVFIKTKARVHELFLIGKLDGTDASTEFTRYHLTKDVEDGMDSEDYRFVDQLDLDGDGTDEIVVEVTGYESEEFRILKRVNGLWIRVHVGGAGGC
ncbi:MAG TPA: hypothetical protein VKD70_08430 [Candidatus Acidoferrum sp.]|nr:hypothetical protein [Candidatus Acidoferrum sp.]